MLALAACGQSGAPSAASSEEGDAQSSYPEDGIDLTLGFGPGSGIDANARMLAPYIEDALGVPVTVVNQEGGGAVPWANELARTEPDGYTFGMIGFPLFQNNTVLSEVDYDPATDFTYLGVLTVDPAVIAVAPDSEYETLGDLIAAGEANPREVAIGATGVGSVDYMIALSMQGASEAEFGIVNFDSTTDGVTAMLSGNLDAMPMTVSSVLPFVEGGQVRVLAAGADESIEQLPDVPTFAEEGVELLVEGSTRAFLAPAGLEPDVKDALAAGIREAIENPEFQAKAEEAGLLIVYMTPEETEALSAELVDAARENLAE